MSGGIRYRPNPTEAEIIAENWVAPQELAAALAQNAIQVRVQDEHSSIQVQDLKDRIQYTLTFPIDENAIEEDGRLYLHDRYVVDKSKPDLVQRRWAVARQGEFFPEGPGWLLSRGLYPKGYSADQGGGAWETLFHKLKVLPHHPEAATGVETQWLAQLHREFPDTFIQALRDHAPVYNEIFGVLQKYRLQMRILEDQSGFSQGSGFSNQQFQMTVVIDRPKKSGLAEEKNGRIYLREAWSLSEDGNHILNWERHFIPTGKISGNLAACLKDLEALEGPQLNGTESTEGAQAFIQSFLHASQGEEGNEKAELTDPKLPQIQKQPTLKPDPRLRTLAQKWLHRLQSMETQSENKSLKDFKDLLHFTLSQESLSVSELAPFHEVMGEDLKGKSLFVLWTLLLEGQFLTARNKIQELSVNSPLIRMMERDLAGLLLQEQSQTSLTVLMALHAQLEAQGGVTPSKSEIQGLWKALGKATQNRPISLAEAWDKIRTQSETEQLVWRQMNRHPLVQELLAISAEPHPRTFHQALQQWTKNHLLQNYGFYSLAHEVWNSLPQSARSDSDLMAWEAGDLSLGQTLDLFQPKLMEAAFAPQNLLAMTAGAGVGNTASRLMWARIPGGTRGATFAAETFGLLFEAPAFVLTHRAYGTLMGRGPLGHGTQNWLTDLGAAYLIFAPLKAARFGAQGGASLLSRNPWWKTRPRALSLAQGGMHHSLGPLGLAMGNGLARSEYLQWQPKSPLGWRGNLLLDGLTYFHFLLGGAMAQKGLTGLSAPVESFTTKSATPRDTGPKTSGPETTQGRAYLDFEMPLGRGEHSLVENFAVLRGKVRKVTHLPEHKVSVQEEDLGVIPLKNNRSLWTFGREHPWGQDLTIGLSPEFLQISRRQGYFEADEQGRLTYTDLSRYGFSMDGERMPTQVPVPLHPGSRLQFGLDGELEFEFQPQAGILPRVDARQDLPENFENAMNPPPRTKRYPTFKDLSDGELKDYIQRVLTSPTNWNSTKKVKVNFGTLVTQGADPYMLNADRTVWFIGRQPEIGIQSEWMEQYMGVIRTSDARQDVAAIHAILYVTESGKVAIQNLEIGRRMAISFPRYGPDDFGPEEVIGFSDPLEVPNWTYLEGPTRILLGEAYTLDYQPEMVTPLERSPFRPERSEPSTEEGGEEILEANDPRPDPKIGTPFAMPDWEGNVLQLKLPLDMEIRPTQDWAGTLLAPDPKDGRPVLLIPTAGSRYRGVRIYSTQAGNDILYMVTSLPSPGGTPSRGPEPHWPSIKVPGESEFRSIPRVGNRHAAFAISDGTVLKVGEMEISLRLPEEP